MKKIHLASVTAFVIFLLCSCGGAPDQSGTPTTSGASATISGEAVYKRTCITCHQADGEGLPNTYPPLAKSDFLADKEKEIKQVISGFTGELVVNGTKYNSSMPAQQLNDDEIAAVLTYVNSNFGNSGGAVSTREVQDVRAKL